MVLFFIVRAGLDIAINRLNQLSINVVGLATLPSTNNSFIIYQSVIRFYFQVQPFAYLHTHAHVRLNLVSLYKVKYLCMMVVKL